MELPMRTSLTQFKAQFVPSLDSVCLSASGRGALVASQVVGIHQLTGVGWHVRVAVLARVGVLASNGCAIDDETVEDVVGIC